MYHFPLVKLGNLTSAGRAFNERCCLHCQIPASVRKFGKYAFNLNLYLNADWYIDLNGICEYMPGKQSLP